MKINSLSRQSFGVSPSNLVRECMVKASLEGKDIKPLIKAMKEVYPYRFMTMLGNLQKVQGIGIADKYGLAPIIGKELPEKWLKEYKKHINIYYRIDGSISPFSGIDYEAKNIFENHAVPCVSKPDKNYIMLFADLKGKPFVEIIDVITENLQKIKNEFTPTQKILNDIEMEFPQYRKHLTEADAQKIAKGTNWTVTI